MSRWNVAAEDAGFKYKQEIVWYKRNPTNFLNDIVRYHENIMIYKLGSPKVCGGFRRMSDVKASLAEFAEASTVLGNLSAVESVLRDKEKLAKYLSGDWRTKKTKCNEYTSQGADFAGFEKRVLLTKAVQNGYKPQSVVSFMPHNQQGYNTAEHNVKHPTVKPIELLEWLIDLCTTKEMTILDPFLGSGTTAIAAWNLERHCIGVEIDPEYYQIAIDRADSARKQLSLFEGRNSDLGLGGGAAAHP